MYIQLQAFDVNSFVPSSLVSTYPGFNRVRAGGGKGHVEERRVVEYAAAHGISRVTAHLIPESSIVVSFTEVVLTNESWQRS